MSEKVTDLEKFVFEHVWRPYWALHPDANNTSGNPERYEDRFGKKRHTLMQTNTFLRENHEYRAHVIGRLARIGVWFPDYIKHPLVSNVRDWIDEWNRAHVDQIEKGK